MKWLGNCHLCDKCKINYCLWRKYILTVNSHGHIRHSIRSAHQIHRWKLNALLYWQMKTFLYLYLFRFVDIYVHPLTYIVQFWSQQIFVLKQIEYICSLSFTRYFAVDNKRKIKRGAIKNGQSRDTGNIGQKTQNKVTRQIRNTKN